MGLEQRSREVQLAQRRALIERTMGDPVPFGTYDDGCVKCGTPKAGHKPNYCFGDQPLIDDLPCRVVGEHLHVACTICGFVWLERCRDWVAPAEEPRVVDP